MRRIRTFGTCSLFCLSNVLKFTDVIYPNTRFLSLLLIVLGLVFQVNSVAAQQLGALGNVGLPSTEEGAPLLVQADEMLYDYEAEAVTANGNVQVYYDGNTLIADQVIYDRKNDQVTAVGNVILTEPNGNVARSDKLSITGDFREGFIKSLSLVTPDDVRVIAESANRTEGNFLIFNRAVYTACEIPKEKEGIAPIWQIKAVKVIHNQKEKTIEYKNATFEFFGLPIAYLPYFSHPDPTVKRKSGFLAPSFGYDSELGGFVETPYFWALAPNYDVTLSPRLYSKQGLLLQGEFRHRLNNGSYRIRAGGIHQLDPEEFQDVNSSVTAPGNRENRGYIATDGLFYLSEHWTAGWDATWTTDDTFLDVYNIDDRNVIVSTAHLTGLKDRNFFSARAFHFRDTIRTDAEEEAVGVLPNVHPVIDYNYVFGNNVLGGELSFDVNALSLTRSIGADVNRIAAALNWRRTFTDSFGQQFTPFAQLRGDYYSVANLNETSSDPSLGSDRDNFFRGTAAVGLEYRFPLISVHSWGNQILEPIAQVILRTDEQEEENIANEDALSLVFDDTTLFEWDKFSGFDRNEGGSRANVGLRYSLNLNNGGFAKLLVGQSFHLGGRSSFAVEKDGIVRNTGLETDDSDFVGALYIEPHRNFGFSTRFRLDEDTLEIERQEVSARANILGARFTGEYVKLNDRSTGELIEREDIVGSAYIPIHREWALFGGFRYDIEGSQTIRQSIGIRYLCDCLNASLEYRESFTRNQDIEPDRSVLFRFHLKSIGGAQFGSSELDGFED